MELVGTHPTILMPFVDQTIKTLANMADLQATAGSGTQENISDYHLKGYGVCVVVRTFGSIEGKVVMNHPVESALAIGNRFINKMLDEAWDFDEINGQISEALTEFANTAIGLATRSLSSSDSQLKFSAPLFINGAADMEYIMEGVEEILSIPIDIEGVDSFSISYLLHQKTC